ncbi:MAG: hypothetical protein OXN88_11305 [Chloroflexota bacterium]|nr:hypothetical protein [Chloroflexota bacterium]
MAELRNDHERRLSTIEGEMKSLATKADLAEFKVEIMEYVRNEIQSAIQAQTEEFRASFATFAAALEKQSEEIRELREKESRIEARWIRSSTRCLFSSASLRCWWRS